VALSGAPLAGEPSIRANSLQRQCGIRARALTRPQPSLDDEYRGKDRRDDKYFPGSATRDRGLQYEEEQQHRHEDADDDLEREAAAQADGGSGSPAPRLAGLPRMRRSAQPIGS